MSTPNKYSPENNVQPPHCPVAECRKLLSSQIFIVAGAAEDSRIARPS